jgi:hypothetical protein
MLFVLYLILLFIMSLSMSDILYSLTSKVWNLMEALQQADNNSLSQSDKLTTIVIILMTNNVLLKPKITTFLTLSLKVQYTSDKQNIQLFSIWLQYLLSQSHMGQQKHYRTIQRKNTNKTNQFANY